MQNPQDVSSQSNAYIDPPSDYIPPAPPIPEPSQVSGLDGVLENGLNALGEPSLQSLGLGSMYPSGLVQQGLEMLHISTGLPWWASIVAGECNGRFNRDVLSPEVLSLISMHFYWLSYE